MAEEATTQESTDSSAEQTAVDSQSSEQTNDSTDLQETSQEATGDQSSSKSTDDASTGDKSKVETQDPKQESKPLSRRSAKYRIQQLNTRIKELEGNQASPKKQEQDDWADEDASDDPKPDVAKLVQEAVQAALKPVITEHTKTADDAEINELFSGEKAADKTKYEGKIRELWNLPQYKDVAASDLYKIAKFDELHGSMDSIKQQAIEEYKQAEKEAKESSASGNSNTSNRTGKTGKSTADMTDKELLEHNERVKAGLA